MVLDRAHRARRALWSAVSGIHDQRGHEAHRKDLQRAHRIPRRQGRRGADLTRTAGDSPREYNEPGRSMTAPDFAPANFSGNSGCRAAFRSALLLTLLRLFAELLKRLARNCHQLLVRCAVHRRRGVQAVAQKRQGDQVLSRQTHMSQSPTGKPAGLFCAAVDTAAARTRRRKMARMHPCAARPA